MKTHVRYSGHVPCPDCQEPLPRQFFNRPDGGVCPHCRTRVELTVFPALFSDPLQEQTFASNRSDEDQAGCYFHPHKEAVVPCGSCGLFLCSLCDTEVGERHICPKCLESALQGQNASQLLTHRSLYGQMALSLAAYPLVLLPFVTLITAPIALFLAVRFWKQPGSLVARSRWRFVVAVILASLQIIGWIAIFSGALS